MIWWLLAIYPLVGLGLGIYYGPKLQKIDHAGFTENVFFYIVTPIIWPFVWRMCAQDCGSALREAREKEEREHEALLESIRKERLAPDPRFAEFDLELGIEPETKHWRLRHPEAAKEYDRNMEIARLNAEIIDDRRLCDVPQFSRGGYIPPTLTELNQGLDISGYVK